MNQTARVLMESDKFQSVRVAHRFRSGTISVFVHLCAKEDLTKKRVYAATEWTSGLFVVFAKTIQAAEREARSRLGRKRAMGGESRIVSAILHQIEATGQANDPKDF